MYYHALILKWEVIEKLLKFFYFIFPKLSDISYCKCEMSAIGWPEVNHELINHKLVTHVN